MRNPFARATLGVLAGIALTACSQEAEETYTGDPERMSTLVQLIPAETPYLAANLEPMPADVTDRFWSAMEPFLEIGQEELTNTVARLEQRTDLDAGERVIVSMLQELDGKLSRDGLEALGLAAEHFAIYGDGALPVLRMGISDRAALEAAIARVQVSAGANAAPQEEAGRTWWRIADGTEPDDPIGIVGILDDHVVFGLAPNGEEDAVRQRLLGLTPPEAHALSRIQTANLSYELLPYGTALIDPVALFDAVVDLGERLGKPAMLDLSDACRADYRRLAGAVPEIVSGYTALDAREIEQRTVVALSSDLIPGVQGIAAAMRGLLQEDQGAMYAAFGVDVMRFRSFAQERVAALRAEPLQCEKFAEQMAMLDEAELQLNNPLPPFVGNLRGVRMVLEDIEVGPGGTPIGGQGLFAVMIDNPQLVVGMGQAFVPEIAEMGLVPDGEPRQVPESLLANSGLADVHAAMMTHGIAFSVGAGMEAELTEFLDAPLPPKGTAPLFAVSYDVKAMAQLQQRGMDAATSAYSKPATNAQLEQRLDAAAAHYYDLFERVRVTGEVTDRGIEILSSTSLN